MTMTLSQQWMLHMSQVVVATVVHCHSAMAVCIHSTCTGNTGA